MVCGIKAGYNWVGDGIFLTVWARKLFFNVQNDYSSENGKREYLKQNQEYTLLLRHRFTGANYFTYLFIFQKEKRKEFACSPCSLL